MEGLIKGPFADELKSKRDIYNRKFAVMQRLYPRIREDDFASFLCGYVQPLVNALHGEYRENTVALCEALYDFALEAAGKRIFQAAPWARECWMGVLACFGGFFVKDPAAFARTIANALFNLSMVSRGAAEKWARLLISLKAFAGTTEDLFNYGKAAAWRCGMAHYRDDALPLLKGFCPGVQRVILGVPGDVSEGEIGDIVSMVEGDPWFDPVKYITGKGMKDPGLDIVSVVSGFRGFRGHFISPPLVESINGGLMAYDRDGSYLIISDTYGTTLSRADLGEHGYTDTKGEGMIDSSGNASFRGLERQFPELASPSSFACSGFTMAVTITSSHSIFLIGERDHAG